MREDPVRGGDGPRIQTGTDHRRRPRGSDLADLVGRFLLRGGETTWVDGPLTRAVRNGAICYLDEVVEARQDTTVVIHPLTDHRRQLPVDRLEITLEASPGFQLVVSYNPGYQSVLKDLKDSTRQRFVAIELDFPRPTSKPKSWRTSTTGSISKGQWALDVSYALSCALRVDDRRAWEHDLLELYLETFAKGGLEAPSFDNAGLAYRRQAVVDLESIDACHAA